MLSPLLEIDSFKEKLAGIGASNGLSKPTVIEERLLSVKMKIMLSSKMFIDIYYNEETKSMTSALILEGERVFGINGYPMKGSWHTHPARKAETHQPIHEINLDEVVKRHLAVAEMIRKETKSKR